MPPTLQGLPFRNLCRPVLLSLAMCSWPGCLGLGTDAPLNPGPQVPGPAVSTVAGGPGPGALGAHINGPALEARFSIPADVTLDLAGNLYVADLGNHAVRRIDPAGVVTDLAGSGAHDLSLSEFANGAARTARFNRPQGVAWSRAGGVYVADTFNRRVRRIRMPGAEVETWAGTGEAGTDDGAGSSSTFTAPRCLAMAPDGSLWVSDVQAVRHILPDRVVVTLAFRDSLTAPVGEVNGLALDAFGNMWISDYAAHRLLRRSSDGAVVVIGGAPGFRDGGWGGAGFFFPRGLVCDAAGNVYLADSGNNAIRRIGADGTVTTLAGGGPLVKGSRDGSVREATFHDPWALALGPNGMLYVADTGNNLIRRIRLAAPARPVLWSEPVAAGAIAGLR